MRSLTGLWVGGSWAFKMVTAAPRHSPTTWSPSHTSSELPIQAQPTAGRGRCQQSRHSHGVIEHDILLGELQQHRIIEELADAHVFTQALQSVGANARMSPASWVTEPGAG